MNPKKYVFDGLSMNMKPFAYQLKSKEMQGPSQFNPATRSGCPPGELK